MNLWNDMYEVEILIPEFHSKLLLKEDTIYCVVINVNKAIGKLIARRKLMAKKIRDYYERL